MFAAGRLVKLSGCCEINRPNSIAGANCENGVVHISMVTYIARAGRPNSREAHGLKSAFMTDCCDFIPVVAGARPVILAAFIFMTGFAFVQAQALEPRGADLCKAIPDQGMQARCYETLNAFGNQREGYRAELPGGWHLSKMQNANGGPDVVSVMHAA